LETRNFYETFTMAKTPSLLSANPGRHPASHATQREEGVIPLEKLAKDLGHGDIGLVRKFLDFNEDGAEDQVLHSHEFRACCEGILELVIVLNVDAV
jgi:hypothetical protein